MGAPIEASHAAVAFRLKRIGLEAPCKPPVQQTNLSHVAPVHEVIGRKPVALWSRAAIIAVRRKLVNSAEFISPDAIPNSR
jgi:hypothetical protein